MAFNRKNLVITTSWDDGHPLDFRVADLLAKYGVRGTFYVPLRNSRPTISPSQIRELSVSFEIGAHTMNHVRLRRLGNSQARQEIIDCKRQLEDILGRDCPVFCFPGGSYSKVHIQMLRDAGFHAARTVELLSFERPRIAHGLSVIPTTIQCYPHRAASYLRNVAKRFNISGLWNLLHRHTKSWSAFAEVLIERAAVTSGTFHLWGHSWEIEETAQWEALERTLAVLAEYKQRAFFATNMELCSNVTKFNGDPRPTLVS
ncbi:MAG TPA: polysaccharide deacetylase family protein [Terriglobales bacterium]|jgi:peptidoglycan/xylan/chitin deacetylase (PgdA/CDA1 family)